LKSKIQAVYQLEELRQLAQDYPLLSQVERNLLDAGEYIVQSNHRLTERLRQMLDERNLQENRRVAELITDVQRLAIANDAPT
jgi:recombinational DNA repair ATPase RecF